jgi:hypothetical protein
MNNFKIQISKACPCNACMPYAVYKRFVELGLKCMQLSECLHNLFVDCVSTFCYLHKVMRCFFFNLFNRQHFMNCFMLWGFHLICLQNFDSVSSVVSTAEDIFVYLHYSDKTETTLSALPEIHLSEIKTCYSSVVRSVVDNGAIILYCI